MLVHGETTLMTEFRMRKAAVLPRHFQLEIGEPAQTHRRQGRHGEFAGLAAGVY